MKVERCSLCDEPTGRSGKSDDSIYYAYSTPAEIGPLCETCRNTLRDEFSEELSFNLDALKKERDELRERLKAAEEVVDAGWGVKAAFANLNNADDWETNEELRQKLWDAYRELSDALAKYEGRK